jgi:predicted AlkP superfamily phosphohydrolase/phosphomutase
MISQNSVLVIGIDGATFDLIKPWASRGELPALARLMEEGAHGVLESVPNTNSAAAWVSFATGNNPGKHGIFYFDEPVFGTYKRRYLNGSFRRSKAVWNYASDAGKSVGVINVPMSYPAEPVNGVMISGIDSPGTWSEGFIHPPHLAKPLRSMLGDYIIEPGIPQLIKAGKKDRALDLLLKTVDCRRRYAKHLMSHVPWDLFIVVFTMSDAVQHFFWKDMDPAHPEHTAEGGNRYGDTILKVYREIDSAISELMDDAGEATVFIVSDHGAGFNQRGAEYLNPWLADTGLLEYSQTPLLRGAFLSALQTLYRLIDKRLSRETKLRLMRFLPGMRERVDAATSYRSVDWSRTKAFNDGARDELWINLMGREPKGIVRAGEEYEKLRDFMMESLLQARDLKTGERVVNEARRREDIYHGKHVSKAPDIFVQWRQDFVISGLQSTGSGKSRPGKTAAAIKPPLFSGGHRRNGVAIVRGPQIKRGHAFAKAGITDLAPTILYLLGLPVPEDMDGRVLQEIIREDYWQRHSPERRPIETESRTDEEDYSQEDKKKIWEKLKGMGYID